MIVVGKSTVYFVSIVMHKAEQIYVTYALHCFGMLEVNAFICLIKFLLGYNSVQWGPSLGSKEGKEIQVLPGL